MKPDSDSKPKQKSNAQVKGKPTPQSTVPGTLLKISLALFIVAGVAFVTLKKKSNRGAGSVTDSASATSTSAALVTPSTTTPSADSITWTQQEVAGLSLQLPGKPESIPLSSQLEKAAGSAAIPSIEMYGIDLDEDASFNVMKVVYARGANLESAATSVLAPRDMLPASANFQHHMTDLKIGQIPAKRVEMEYTADEAEGRLKTIALCIAVENTLWRVTVRGVPASVDANGNKVLESVAVLNPK